jgi:amidase
VAAGLTALEIGSDIGGSIRVLSHLRRVRTEPTENRIHVARAADATAARLHRAGQHRNLARTMADIELAWTIINPPTWKYFSSVPQKPRVKNSLGEYRICWYDDVGETACGEDTRSLLRKFVDALSRGGVTVEQKPFDASWLREAYAAYGTIFGSIVGQDAPWIIRQLLKRQFAALGKGSQIGIVGPLKTGLDLRFKTFSRALRRRTDTIAELQRRFDEYDFIISPAAVGPAFHQTINSADRFRGPAHRACYSAWFNAIYNSCGNPVLVVPGMSREGLPIVSIAATHYAELVDPLRKP